jgi:hypothetical protein
MKIRRLAVICTLAFATAISLAPGTTSGAAFVCPDGYAPEFAILAPEKDKNNNLIICKKQPPSSNEHTNVKDDKGMYVDDIV